MRYVEARCAAGDMAWIDQERQGGFVVGPYYVTITTAGEVVAQTHIGTRPQVSQWAQRSRHGGADMVEVLKYFPHHATTWTWRGGVHVKGFGVRGRGAWSSAVGGWAGGWGTGSGQHGTPVATVRGHRDGGCYGVQSAGKGARDGTRGVTWSWGGWSIIVRLSSDGR
ncbi:hypothetical protein GCM10010485_01910 [Streptosporangium carneum]